MSRSVLSIAVLAVATTASPLPGQEAARPLVSTTGSAEIRVVPDLADLIFQVEVRNSDLSKARKEQAERVIKVLAALRKAGITEAELQTSPIEIVPHYADRESLTPATRARAQQESATAWLYSVSQFISWTLHDIKKIPNVTADAVAAGVTRIQGANLRTSELPKYRDQARVKAIRAAKEKAIALASELGMKVGRPFTISESAFDGMTLGPGNAPATQVSEGVAAPYVRENAESGFAPGSISVSAQVSVSFLLD
jgi:uncharacterized protein YggE